MKKTKRTPVAKKRRPTRKPPHVEITAAMRGLQKSLDRIAAALEERIHEEIADQTMLLCVDCRKEFLAANDPFVRLPGGDIVCVPCHVASKVKLVQRREPSEQAE